MKQIPLLITLLAAALAAPVAHAGPAEQVVSDVEYVLMWMPSLRESPAGRIHGRHEPVDKCRKAIDQARKAGLADSTQISSSQFNGTLGQLASTCDEYAQLLLMMPAAAAQAETAQSLGVYSTVDPKSLGADMGSQMAARGKTCMDATDAAIKAGAPADRKSKIGDSELTLAEGRAKICQAMVDFGAKLGGDIKQAHGAERDRIAAKYTPAGIKGKKLDLFIEYDDVYWLGKGCEKILDVKQLARAKKLYQRLENADGTHSIRTYTFNGNAVKSVKDKVYRTAAQAANGCK